MPTRPRVAGRERRLYALIASLPYSGAQTAFFSFEMTIESFLEGHARVFEWLEGVPRECVYDNRFGSLGELDGQYADWRDEVCNRRRHASGRFPVGAGDAPGATPHGAAGESWRRASRRPSWTTTRSCGREQGEGGRAAALPAREAEGAKGAAAARADRRAGPRRAVAVRAVSRNAARGRSVRPRRLRRPDADPSRRLARPEDARGSTGRRSRQPRSRSCSTWRSWPGSRSARTSASSAHPAPAKRTWRSRSRSRPASRATGSPSRPPRSGSHGSRPRRTATSSRPSCAGSSATTS